MRSIAPDQKKFPKHFFKNSRSYTGSVTAIHPRLCNIIPHSKDPYQILHPDPPPGSNTASRTRIYRDLPQYSCY